MRAAEAAAAAAAAVSSSDNDTSTSTSSDRDNSKGGGTDKVVSLDAVDPDALAAGFVWCFLPSIFCAPISVAAVDVAQGIVASGNKGTCPRGNEAWSGFKERERYPPRKVQEKDKKRGRVVGVSCMSLDTFRASIGY